MQGIPQTKHLVLQVNLRTRLFGRYKNPRRPPFTLREPSEQPHLHSHATARLTN
jgi:hypothetical protein